MEKKKITLALLIMFLGLSALPFTSTASNHKYPCQSITFPAARIAIISLSTQDDERKKYNTMTRANLEQYAKKWGYDLHYYTDILDTERSGHWSKIVAFQQHILSEKYEWLVWLDDDMIITNQEIKLEQFIEKYGNDKNFFVQMDAWNWSMLNSGIFFLRVCPWSNNFLQATYDVGTAQPNLKRNCCHEQSAFGELTKRLEFGSKMLIIREKSLQGFHLPEAWWRTNTHRSLTHLKWAPGDFIIHFPARSCSERQKLALQYLKSTSM